MAKKAPNYSPELTDAIVADYQAGKPVEDIADAIGKSVRSVRSKLVREGVYVAQEKPQGSKRDNGPTKKELLGKLEEVDPNVGDMPLLLQRLDNAEINCVLSNSFGFGGTNATLAFSRVES